MTINDQSLIWRSQKITREVVANVSSFNNHHGFQSYHICHLGGFTTNKPWDQKLENYVKKHKTGTFSRQIETRLAPHITIRLYNIMII